MRMTRRCVVLQSLIAIIYVGNVIGIQQGKMAQQVLANEYEYNLITETSHRKQNKLSVELQDDVTSNLLPPHHFNQQQNTPKISLQLQDHTSDVASNTPAVDSTSNTTSEPTTTPLQEPHHQQTVVSLKGSENELITNEDGEVFLVRVDPVTKETSMLNMSKIKDVDFQNAKVSLDMGADSQPKIEKYSLEKYEPFQWYRVLSEGVQPNRRGGHSLTVIGQTIVLFGGCLLDMECYNELFFFDIMSKEWTKPKTMGEPPAPRGGHSATLVGEYIYIFGGSNDHGILSDIHRFNLESRLWEQFEYEGSKPTGRTNHKAVLDNDGRIVIFGGYTNQGYSNDVYFLDLVNMRWVKPMVNGEPPLGRENFSMNLVRESYIWVFGGYALGGETNDLWQLDVDMLKWTRIFNSFGSKPIERQGHQMILHGKLLFTVGGCNYKQQRCFNDLFQLHTDDLTWTKLDFPLENQMKPRDNFGISLMGSDLYLFGGCQMMENCYNDFQVMNITDVCPRNCSGRGTCRNNRCTCDLGFQGEECEVRLLCEENCLNRGVCGSDARCHCFPGYTGNICQIYVPCPSNCTSIDNGRCDLSGKCLCTEGNSGDACEIGTNGFAPIKTVCPNNCSHHGKCNDNTGVCICDAGYGDLDCSLTEEIKEAAKQAKIKEEREAEHALKTQQEELEKEQKALEANKNQATNTTVTSQVIADGQSQPQSVDESNATTGTVTTPAENTNNPPIGQTDQLLQQDGNNNNVTGSVSPAESTSGDATAAAAASTPTTQEANSSQSQVDLSAQNGGIVQDGSISDKITEFIHSQMLKSAILASQDKSAKIQDLKECENNCSFNGVCIQGDCYCEPGITGEDCSVSKISQLNQGQKLVKFFFFGPVFFICGLVLGYFHLKQQKQKQEEQEFGGIGDYNAKEEEENDHHEAKKNFLNHGEAQNKGVEDGDEQDSFSRDEIEVKKPDQNDSQASIEEYHNQQLPEKQQKTIFQNELTIPTNEDN